MELTFAKKTFVHEKSNFEAPVEVESKLDRLDADEFSAANKLNLYDFGIKIPRFASIFRQICGGRSEND